MLNQKLNGNGIGKSLMKYIENEFVLNGKNKMVLWCLEENRFAREFYEKMGGKLNSKRTITINEKKYMEVSYVYDLLEQK